MIVFYSLLNLVYPFKMWYNNLEVEGFALEKENKKTEQIKPKGRLKFYLNWPIYMVMILFAIDIYVFVKSKEAGLLIAVMICIFLVAHSLFIINLKKDLHRGMVDFAVGYSQIQKALIEDLTMPFAILDSQDIILWHNKAFAEATGGNEVAGKRIYAVLNKLTRESMPKDTDSVSSIRIEVGERFYHVECKKIDADKLIDKNPILQSPKGGCLIALTMKDETEFRRVETENKEQKFVAGIVYIDNYDEALENVEEMRRSMLTAVVERKINQFFSAGGSLVKKLEKDRFLVVMPHKVLDAQIAEKYAFLEEVKSINVGNDKRVTISVGIGAGKESYADNYELARFALEQALGRGGDQVVVKENDKLSYFGGKSQSQEKNTRVKARVKAQAIREAIQTKEKVIIMGHQLGDMDSFGSCIGMHRAVKALGKKAYIVAKDVTETVKPISDKFYNNPEYEQDMIIDGDEALNIADDNTLLIVVDTNTPSRLECPGVLDKCGSVVVIDHHRQGDITITGAVVSHVEPFASSACEMVVEILQYITDNLKLKQLEADAMYAGMIIDTNNFTNKAGVRTFEAAAFLKRAGADTQRVRKLLRTNMKDYKARAEAISKMQVFSDAFAISICRSDGLTSPTVVAAQAANELLDVEGIKASFVVTRYNDLYHVSARSIDEVNVQIIMERLGGGGHMNVAAAQIHADDIDAACKIVRDTVNQMKESGEI